MRWTRGGAAQERRPLSNGSYPYFAGRQLVLEPLVPIQAELRREGKVRAELDEQRSEVFVDEVDVVMVDHRGRTDDPAVSLPGGVASLLGTEDAGLLLASGLADEQDPFLAGERSRGSAARCRLCARLF